MYRKRILKIAGPSFLLLGSVMAYGAMRANLVTPTASGNPPYEQSASDLDGLGQASKGPLFNRSANEQRASQTRILEQILAELRATRQLLANGNARVRVESIEIDYDRMASLIQSVQSSQSDGSNDSGGSGSNDVIEAPASQGTGSGSIRRISSVGSEQVTDDQ
jgi:hypothetical protein